MVEIRAVPRISVLLPIYQAQRTLDEAVESVLAQSFDDFELLALDDGSTDASIAILERLAARDERVRIVHAKHAGLTRRLNDGLATARGSLIARMDADDVCRPDRFEKQVAFLDVHPDCVAVGTGALLVDPERWPIRARDQVSDHARIESRLLHGDGGALLHPSAMYRARALRRVGGYDEKLDGGEDLDLHLRLAEIGALANLAEPLLEYRQSLHSVSGARRMQVRRNQDAAIRAALRRRGLDPADAPARAAHEPNPAPDEVWAVWSGWAIEAGFSATARKYALAAFRARRRHWKLPIRAWLQIRPDLWRRLRRRLGVRDLARPTRDGVDPTTARPHVARPGVPAVSVLMSVHDGARYLRDAIDSVLEQSFRDFEFLIVDDASTDPSAEIIETYDDPRIRCITNPERLGLTRSLNRAAALARGRYLARMDADDLSLPDRFERQVAILDAEPDCALVATWAEKIDANARQVGLVAAPTGGAPLRRRLGVENCIIHGSVVIRRERFYELGGYDERMRCAQDYDLWLRVAQDHEIRVLAEPLYCWRQHADSISANRPDEQRRFAESARARARRARIVRVLEALDAGRIALDEAAARIAAIARDEELGRLEREPGADALARLSNRLRRSRAFGRWVWMPPRRRRARAILAGSGDRASALRAVIDPS